MPSRAGHPKRPAAGRQRSRQPSAKGSKSKSSLSRAAQEAVHEVLDVPHFSGERSLDSLEITAQMLKGSLNASFRDGEERFGSSANGNGRRDGSGSGGSVGGSGSGGSRRGSNRGSDRGSSNGGGRGASGAAIPLNAEHVDVPHWDDMLKSAGEAQVQAQEKQGKAAPAGFDEEVPLGGADAAAGGGSPGGSRRGAGGCRDSTNPGALDASLGSGGSGGSSMSSSNMSRAGSQTSRASSSRRGKNGAIVIEDEESVGSSLWGSFSRRGPLELAQEDSASGRNIDAPNGSKKDRRGSRLFENLWGSAQNVSDGQGRHDLSDERRESDAFSGRSDESESRSMQLMRTASGRVGFRRSRTHGGESDERPPPRYYGSRCVNSCRGATARYAKWTTVCIVGSVALAATIGALVAMVPLWMDSEERGESGELGGLAYGGEGEAMGSGEKGSLSGPEASPARGATADGNSASASYSASSAASSELPPPPHNLHLLCSRASLSQPAEYEACLAACLPSRCCLVPADEPYEVWTMRESVDPKTLARSHPDAPTIGTTITSCFREFPDICVHYYNQCAVLGASALLPRRPPMEEEVESMNGRQKLELAERVNRACAKVRNGGDRSECRMLCAEKECCFEKNGEEEEKKTHAWHPALEESHGAGKAKDIPLDALAIDGFLETSRAEDPHDVDMAAQNYYGPGYGRHTPTAKPTSLAEPIGDYPTLAGASYRPTPTSTMLRRLAHTEEDEKGQALAHAEIPGEEDFVYVAERPNGSEDSTAALASAHEALTPAVPDTGYREPAAVPTFEDGDVGRLEAGEATDGKNCVADPKRHCTTYAGCAPLFAK